MNWLFGPFAMPPVHVVILLWELCLDDLDLAQGTSPAIGLLILLPIIDPGCGAAL